MIFTVKVNDTVPAGANQITNTATITDVGDSGNDPTPRNNTATDIDTLVAAPDLSLTKSDGVASTTPGTTLS